MRVFAAWLAACALLPDAALLMGCSRGPTLPRLEANDVILAFGDSLTYGTGASAEESYPAVLETLVHRRVVREGYPGETTAQGLERLPELLDRYHPRLLLLCMGGNDMLQQVDTGTIAGNLRKMIQQNSDDVSVIVTPAAATSVNSSTGTAAAVARPSAPQTIQAKPISGFSLIMTVIWNSVAGLFKRSE